MQNVAGKLAPPSDDKRWRLVDATMRRNGSTSQALIETLHTVQQAFGYLDDTSLRYVARSLGTPLSRVYGVATFYHFFTLKPQGKHSCVVCLGTACYLKGSPEIMSRIEQEYEVAPGHTTEDMNLSLLTARCVGACGLAPVAVVDEEIMGNLSADQAMEQLRKVVES